ncbi:ATP-binding cell division protein involved in recruitment of FtsK to Z ring [Haemophilus influenzae]|uniref:ATP-binding cell division protein involved in recruitment of FtsK to Z ring n=1 Tax=Haemophilus influenzae TaxID=727 RepID=A0A2X1QRC0_HAEIF|nr:ATP-binding cell division protein involved in recruitment of FtsK to Z ring [Haemophilus influenzae]
MRIASPLNITGLTDYVNRPQYSTVVGLLQYNHSNSDDDLISGSDDSEGTFFESIWQGVKKIVNKVRSEF